MQHLQSRRFSRFDEFYAFPKATPAWANEFDEWTSFLAPITKNGARVAFGDGGFEQRDESEEFAASDLTLTV